MTVVYDHPLFIPTISPLQFLKLTIRSHPPPIGVRLIPDPPSLLRELSMIPARRLFAALISLALCSAAHAQKPSIWDDREVTLTDEDTVTPVNVAIWDSGTDLTLFRGQVYTDMTSGGLRSDQHDIAYDIKKLPAKGFIPILDAQQTQQYAVARPLLKGFTDLQLGLDTADAAAVKQRLAASDGQAFLEQLRYFSLYAQGTEVASVAARGNPAIRMGAGRIGFDWHNTPAAPTEELARRAAAADHAYVDWYDSNEMRVVSVAWTISPQDYEAALEKNNVGDASERKALAAKLFTLERNGLYEAMKSSSNILFICSAGKPGTKGTLLEAAPANFKLPNVLTVGAVDQAGDEATFTAYGGYKTKLSGPTMATPAVVNLAAKLIALNTALTPEQVIKLIVGGSTPSADGKRHLINPRKSIEMSKAMAATAATGKKKK